MFSNSLTYSFHTKPAIPVPRMPLRIFALAEVFLFLARNVQKYTSKANIYLYQHPLLTSIILFCIGLIFGIYITLLTIEIIYSVQILALLKVSTDIPRSRRTSLNHLLKRKKVLSKKRTTKSLKKRKKLRRQSNVMSVVLFLKHFLSRTRICPRYPLNTYTQ